MDKLLNILVLW